MVRVIVAETTAIKEDRRQRTEDRSVEGEKTEDRRQMTEDRCQKVRR